MTISIVGRSRVVRYRMHSHVERLKDIQRVFLKPLDRLLSATHLRC